MKAAYALHTNKIAHIWKPLSEKHLLQRSRAICSNFDIYYLDIVLSCCHLLALSSCSLVVRFAMASVFLSFSQKQVHLYIIILLSFCYNTYHFIVSFCCNWLYFYTFFFHQSFKLSIQDHITQRLYKTIYHRDYIRLCNTEIIQDYITHKLYKAIYHRDYTRLCNTEIIQDYITQRLYKRDYITQRLGHSTDENTQDSPSL